MRWPLLMLFLLFTLPLVGCKSPCDKVESALRVTEEQLTKAREDLSRQGVYTAALEHEMRIVRGEVIAGSPGKPVAVYPVRSLALGNQTGGHDSPSGLGDDGLQVIFIPRDAQSQPIQVPGDAMLQVLEISAEGHKRLLSSWYIDRDQIKASWKNGLLSQGYNVILPWKVLPGSEKLRLVAHFRLEDGRVFEADRDVSIRLPKGAAVRAMPVVVSDPTPMPTPTPILPQPKTILTPPAPTPPAPTPPAPVIPTRPMPTVDPVPVVPPTPPAPVKAKPPEGPSLGARPMIDPDIKPAAVSIGRPMREQ